MVQAPKALCPTVLIEWLEASPYAKLWREQLHSAPLLWAMDQHQEAHMAAMIILKWCVAVQTAMVDSPLLKVATMLEPKNRKQTP